MSFLPPPGALLLIKWCKTMQFKDKVKIIEIPELPMSPLCPVAALWKMLDSSPKGRNKPLFQILSNMPGPL